MGIKITKKTKHNVCAFILSVVFEYAAQVTRRSENVRLGMFV